MSVVGAATQICSQRFDRQFFDFPTDVRERIQQRVDQIGRNLRGYPHFKMEGADTYRLRVGDYRVIYQVDAAKNEIYLVAVGHRRDIYKKPSN